MKLKKLLIRCSAVALITMCISTTFSPVFASEKLNHAEDESVVTRAEETEWRYRVVDGKLQKRLWSLTYGKWLTEWEWV